MSASHPPIPEALHLPDLVDRLLDAENGAALFGRLTSWYQSLPAGQKALFAPQLRRISQGLEERKDEMLGELRALQNQIFSLQRSVPAHIAYLRAAHILPEQATTH
jgi:hypothetical protein